MKAQRFRSLPERSCIAAVFFFACASVSAMVLPEISSANSEQIDELKKLKDECGKEKAGAFAIYADKNSEKLLEAFDPELQCKENFGNELQPLSHNARQLAPELWTKRPSFILRGRNEAESRKLGACRTAYGAIKDSFNNMQARSHNYCNQLSHRLNDALACGGLEKKCEEKFKRVKEAFSSYTEVKEAATLAMRYLELASKSADNAKLKYEKDLEALQIELNKRSTEAGNPLETLKSIDGRDDLKPSNGNANTLSYSDYYKQLTTNEFTSKLPIKEQMHRFGGSLITELREAAKRAYEYSRKIEEQTAKQTVLAESMVLRIDTMLAGIENAGSVKGGTIAKINTHIPTVTGAVGLGTQVLGSGNQSASAPAALTGGSGGPSLATIAAAGAALHNSLGGASSSSSEPDLIPVVSQQQPAQPISTPDTANLAGTGVAANGAGDTNALPNTSEKKADIKENASAGVENFPAFGATSGGTSRMLAGAKKPSTSGAPAQGNVGNADIGDDSLSNFGSGGMSPKPAPKGNQLSAGAEVANLLGQMKNLFNFDEGGAPMGGAPVDGGGYPADPGIAEPGMAHEQQAEGEPEATEAGALPTEDPAGEVPQVQASHYGRSDTSLFSRVHAKHVSCMERGLVLYQLGERVE